MSSTERTESRRLLLSGAPRPLLASRAEQRLPARHREVLDELETMLRAEGISSFTIGELAARVRCSRRTLYELAPSKEQLQLLVLDRLLQRLGRSAVAAVDPTRPLVEQLRQYVTSGIDYAFRRVAYQDLADVPAARRLLDRHFRFAATIMERMIGLAVDRGEIRPVNAAVAAAMISTSALHLTQADVLTGIDLDMADVLDEMFSVLMLGLAPAPD